MDLAFSLIFPHIFSFFTLFFAHLLANIYILEGNILSPPFCLECIQKLFYMMLKFSKASDLGYKKYYIAEI